MDRRNLLKTLTIAPFFSLEKSEASAMAPPFATDIYLFLHGFFFMEFQGNQLIITAPEVGDHDYRIGQPDKALLKPVPSNTTLDWTGTLTGDNLCTSRGFAIETLQFSKAITGVGDLKGAFHFRVILPCPFAFYPLRKGPAGEFPGKGNVWNDIYSRLKGSGSKDIALVTCLKYQGSIDPYWPRSSSPYRYHLYAEPDCKLELEHTRHALSESKQLFANSGAFDLDIDVNSTLTRVDAKKPDDEYPGTLSGFSTDDEKNLAEVLNASYCAQRAVNVANCGQYGILNS